MISVVVLTKNEEDNLGQCLETVKWADEIIIVDDYSTDKTEEVAQKFGAIFIKNYLHNDFGRQRNLGLEKARGEWVFFLDADERVTKELAEEIAVQINSNKNVNGYKILRRDYLWNKQLDFGESGQIGFVRLAKKGKGCWVGKVHELWEVRGKIHKLKNQIKHYPHPDITTFLNEINFYSEIRAIELYQKKVKGSLLQIIFYPKAKFVLNYFLRGGFLDGMNGFIFALMMSFHSFLTRAKLYLLWQKR